jgi:hypothetical protein
VSRSIAATNASNPWLAESLVGESRIECKIIVLGVKLVVQARIGHQHRESRIECKKNRLLGVKFALQDRIRHWNEASVVAS